MQLRQSSTSKFLSSVFTREEGYTAITSNFRYTYKTAVKILNTFTPQGASPDISIRIGGYEQYYGTGYYHMKDQNNAFVSIILNENITGHHYISIPTDNRSIIDIVTKQKMISRNEFDLSMLTEFDHNDLSSIIYSIITADNIILFHPDHEERLHFFNTILQIIPTTVLQYNRITTNCTELEGNTNIIGVDDLPPKYRDHRIYDFSYDTIFIDLANKQVSGGGMKINEIASTIAKYIPDIEQTRKFIEAFITRVQSQDIPDKTDNNYHMIYKIHNGLGNDIETQDDWLMHF